MAAAYKAQLLPVPTREGDIVRVVNGVPAWVAPTSAALPAGGTEGQVLKMVGGQATWGAQGTTVTAAQIDDVFGGVL